MNYPSYSRPPPPQGAPRSYTYVNRVYRRSLRPVVIMTTLLATLWTLLWATSRFKSISVYKTNGYDELSILSLVLGILYIVACVIELFGLFSALSQRTPLVRAYAFLSVLSALLVVGSSLINVIIHFVFKSDLLNLCKTATTGDTVTFSYGLFGPTTSETLTPDQAQTWCDNAYSHDSWADIVALLIEIFLGFVFTTVAFGFYRQIIDPTSPVNSSRVPANLDIHPEHYEPYNPYNPAYVPPIGEAVPQYAPPEGHPPEHGKPPAYGYTGKDEAFDPTEFRADKKDDPFADFEESPERNDDRNHD